MNDQIIVIGHKSPDTDTVVSAMSAAYLLNKRDNTTNYVPKISGNLNTETEYVQKLFAFAIPEILAHTTGEKVFLVDHNEESQIVDGEKEIVGIIDHHKMKFESTTAIEIMTKPWGCACTIIYDMYQKEDIPIPDELKGPMLCAILSDTVILKSPTTTAKDIEVVKQLALETNQDYKELGMNMFKAKAQVANKTPLEIIKNDFKDFSFDEKKVGVGQIETPDLEELDEKIPAIIAELKSLKASDDYDTIILMLTDIIEEGSKLLIVSNDDGSRVANLFKTSITDNITALIPGMMSRKKQVAPILSEQY